MEEKEKILKVFFSFFHHLSPQDETQVVRHTDILTLTY